MTTLLRELMPVDQLRAAKAAKALAQRAYQEANTVVIEGVRIRPAIGKTGRKDNVGWEMHKVVHKTEGDDWYVSTKEEALGKLGKFLAR